MKYDRINHRGFVVQHKITHLGYLIAMLMSYAYCRFWKRDLYAASAVALRYERIATSMGWPLSPFLEKINRELITSLKDNAPRNILVEAFLKSQTSDGERDAFKDYDSDHQIRLKHPRQPEDPIRQGNLLLLKSPAGEREKGVLLLKYNYAFKNFISLYDPIRIAKRFRIVLEPSYWGYRDPGLLFFIGMGTDVIVQAPYAGDYEYIASLQSNLIPVKLGAGDWVDPDMFHASSAEDKRYDLVMVASWIPMKRHRLLFSSLRKCGNAIDRVALLGYPIEGRTQSDVLADARAYGVENKLDVYESIPREKAAEIIRQSKVGVMLSLREGANKGMYECFFSGVPIILSNGNIGVNRNHINSATGVAVEDHELPQKIQEVVARPDRFDPRSWAIKNTGYKNASARLNQTLKDLARRAGEPWTQDIFAKKNEPNAQFADERDRIAADQAMKQMKELLRQ